MCRQYHLIDLPMYSPCISDGYGFKHNSTITVLDQVNGNKVGWPMGAILYEINSLPWELEQPVPREPWGKFFCAAAVGQSIVY